MKMFYSVIAAAVLAVSAGCSALSGSYQSTSSAPRSLYCEPVKRSFAYEGTERNPVIVIHGLLGAQLRDYANQGEVVWGRFALWDMVQSKSFRTLALPMWPPSQWNSPGTVAPYGMLKQSTVDFLCFRFYLDNYEPLLQLLRESGYVPEGEVMPEGKHFYSLFLFYYDWRLDIASNAARLAEFIEVRKAYLKQRYKAVYGIDDFDVRFDLIGHSMGGLVARYYTQFGNQPLGSGNEPLPQLNWAGARNVNKVIMAGTPNAGYTDTFMELLNGLQMLPLAPVYPAGVIGTFPSYYQMLPDPGSRSVRLAPDQRVADVFDPRLWEKYGWGLASQDKKNQELLAELLPDLPEAMRSEAARQHLRRCLDAGKRFKQLMAKDAGSPPAPVRFYLFAGDGMLTNHTLIYDPEKDKVDVLKQEPGDGKITITSARFDTRDGSYWAFHMHSPIPWRAIYYLTGAHMGILTSDSFMSNLRSILLVEP